MIKNVHCLWLSEALAQVSVAERGPRSGFAGTQRAKGLARLQILFAPGVQSMLNSCENPKFLAVIARLAVRLKSRISQSFWRTRLC